VDDGDLLVIDKSPERRNDSLAICFFNRKFTLKRIKRVDDRLWLMPANPDFEPIEVKPGDELTICEIVSWIVKKTY
jgi:DNA polymerase V